MTKDEAEATPATNKPDQKKPKKKKEMKVKKVLEVPPDVATAYLVLRAALQGVLGIDVANANAIQVSPFHKTYVKQPGTGKFSVSLGRRCGLDCCLVALPDTEDADGVEELWKAIEGACTSLVNRAVPVRILQLPASGDDASMVIGGDGNVPKQPKGGGGGNKGGAEQQLQQSYVPVACLEHPIDDGGNHHAAFLAVCPEGGRPYAHAGGVLGDIRIDRSQSSVTAGKKARECKLVVAFTVVGQDADNADNDGEDHSHSCACAMLAEPWNPTTTTSSMSSPVPWTPPVESTVLSADVRALLKRQCTQPQSVRFPEGQALLDKQQRAAEEATAETAAKAAAAVAASQEDQQKPEAEEQEMVVNVEKVEGKIDYDRLVKQFGSTLITPSLMDQLRSRSKVPLHRFLRRNIFFSHRDLDTLLNALKEKKSMYLYTGRGPSSSSMHLGHLIPFLFTKWLQEAFDVPLVVQMTDDEKFLFKGSYDEAAGDNLNEFARLTIENAKDIIACGFDYDKTFLFSDLDYVGRMYPNIVRIWKAVTTNTVNGIFGFDGSSNIGKVAFPAVQAAPSFASSFPTVLECDSAAKANDWLCLIPCAIDQDPYFRMTRDVAHKLVPDAKTHGLGGKPALIHSKFFPPLQGATGKMSSSDSNSAIFLTDTPDEIERKIRGHAFSGGRDTKKEQEELGADLDVDVSYQWLTFFLEDDEELERIGREYGSGSGEYWSTGTVKKKLIDVLQQLVADHQRRRAAITDADVRKWMQERSIV